VLVVLRSADAGPDPRCLRLRYYSNDTQAELIVRLGAHVTAEMDVSVCASVGGKVVVPCSAVAPTLDDRATVLPFSLSAMQATVNSTIVITFTAKDLLSRGAGKLSGEIVRRFARVAPPSDDGSDGAAVTVDHRHRALRVNGELFLGRGFYWPSTQRLSLSQER